MATRVQRRNTDVYGQMQAAALAQEQARWMPILAELWTKKAQMKASWEAFKEDTEYHRALDLEYMRQRGAMQIASLREQGEMQREQARLDQEQAERRTFQEGIGADIAGAGAQNIPGNVGEANLLLASGRTERQKGIDVAQKGGLQAMAGEFPEDQTLQNFIAVGDVAGATRWYQDLVAERRLKTSGASREGKDVGRVAIDASREYDQYLARSIQLERAGGGGGLTPDEKTRFPIFDPRTGALIERNAWIEQNVGIWKTHSGVPATNIEKPTTLGVPAAKVEPPAAPTAQAAGQGKIRVRFKATGETGYIPADKFDPDLFEKI
jgi:hypothetical protein